jgi:hypothetical protein
MTANPVRPPAGRYGPEPDERSRRLRVIGLWSLGVLGVAGVVWLGLGMARTPVTWQDVGFRIDGDTIEVTYDVIRIDPAVGVTCRLEALNVRHAQVGVVTIDVPPGASTAVRMTTAIRTSEEPVTGVVDSCWVDDVG